MEAVLGACEAVYHTGIKDYLRILNTAQKALLEIQERKRVALVGRDLDLANNIQQQEDQIQKHLEVLLDRRQQLLTQMRTDGLAGQSLRDVCRFQGWDRDPETAALLQEARQLSDSLRQTSWGTWVFTHRASQFYGSILEMIAQGGKKSMIYHDGSAINQEPTGGSLLDASI